VYGIRPGLLKNRPLGGNDHISIAGFFLVYY